LINSLVDVGLADENRFIKTFHTFGMIRNTDRWELHAWIAVDWDEHGRLQLTNAMVTVDDRWTNGLNPGLIEQADGFGALIREFGLDPHYAWNYSDHISADPARKIQANELMGLTTVDFQGQPAGRVEDHQANRIAGLGEVTFGSESAFRD
jgi:hypothetical protein